MIPTRVVGVTQASFEAELRFITEMRFCKRQECSSLSVANDRDLEDFPMFNTWSSVGAVAHDRGFIGQSGGRVLETMWPQV